MEEEKYLINLDEQSHEDVIPVYIQLFEGMI